MYLNLAYDLTSTQEQRLLAALLSQLRPDGVRLILRANIISWIQKYEKAGARFTFWADKETMRISCIERGTLDKMDFDRLDMLADLYNTINQWGVEI